MTSKISRQKELAGAIPSQDPGAGQPPCASMSEQGLQPPPEAALASPAWVPAAPAAEQDTATGTALASLTRTMDHTSTTPHSPGRSAPCDQRIRVDDAVLPQDVARALTFHGATPAWALLKRLKSLENRPYRLPCGGWIAVHVGSGSWRGDYSLQIEGCPSEEALMNVYGGCIVGLFKVKECRRPGNCGANVWAEGPVCNVVEAVVELPSPIPIQKGKLSLWALEDDVRLQIASQVLDVAVMDLSLLPLYEPIVGPITPGRNRSYNRTRSPSPTSTTLTPPPSSPRRPSSTEPPAWSIESAASPRYAAAQSFFAARYPHNEMPNWRQLMAAVDEDAWKQVALDLAFLPALARSTAVFLLVACLFFQCSFYSIFLDVFVATSFQLMRWTLLLYMYTLFLYI